MPRPVRAEALSDTFVWRLSDVWRLSVAYIGKNSRRERSRKTKIAQGSEKNYNDGLPDVEKVLRWFSRFDTIPACDGQPATQPRRRSKYALCISASRSKKPAFRDQNEHIIFNVIRKKIISNKFFSILKKHYKLYSSLYTQYSLAVSRFQFFLFFLPQDA